MVITMAKLRMAHASTHGARKSPGPKSITYKQTNTHTHKQTAVSVESLSGLKMQL